MPKHVLTIGSALSAAILGLELMGFLQFEGSYVSAGVMLFAFGVVIAVDYWNERSVGTVGLRVADVIAFVVVACAFALGIVCMASISLEGWEKVAGFLFILLAAVMTFSMLREKDIKDIWSNKQ